MDICFNSLTITAPPGTVDFLLSKGHPERHGNVTPTSQGFSFKPLLEALDCDPSDQESLQEVWINWIENSKQGQQHTLTIEFESRETPPLFCIDAVIQCLQQEQMPFQLHFQYRLENEAWEGEITASSDSTSRE